MAVVAGDICHRDREPYDLEQRYNSCQCISYFRGFGGVLNPAEHDFIIVISTVVVIVNMKTKLVVPKEELD